MRRRLALAALAGLALGLPAAPASPLAPARRLASDGEAGAALYAATRQVLLVVPSVRSQGVAEAIRAAAVVRGVVVFVIADAGAVEERAGYLAGLSLIDHVQVRVMRGVNRAVAVLDGRYMLEGPLLLDAASPLTRSASYVADDPARAAREATRFAADWARARPYVYAPPSPARPGGTR